MKPHALAIALLAAPLLLGGCVYSSHSSPPLIVANPNPPVPPPQPEQRPLPPPTEDQLVWRIGQWEWVGNGYVWRPGEYEKLGGHSNEYLPGHWVVQDGAWVWERGHWL
jgi:WXXGXW repeat (2 copies)